MSNERGGPALPELRTMLGQAVAGSIAKENAGRRRRPTWGRRAPLRTRLVVPLAVMATLGALAASAGALGLISIAPQLSSGESGVKPDAVPGETKVLEGPAGEKVEATVSPCIKSDPKGYSAAELNDPEWCLHAPGAASPAPNAKEHVYQSNSGAWQRE